MTLLLGPPGSGKTTLLLALAGRLDKDLKVFEFLNCLQMYINANINKLILFKLQTTIYMRAQECMFHQQALHNQYKCVQ